MKVKPFLLAGALAVLGSLPLSSAELDGQAVTLDTSDGWALSAVYKAPKEQTRTVILLHDLGKDKTAFSKFASSLWRAGFGYLALDLRGHGQSVNQGEYSSFAREGLDNEFNKMPRDVDAAVSYLQKKGVDPQDMVLLGAGLGANVAAKSVTLTPDIGSLALITPTANTRDVLTIPAMRLYKGNVLIAASADDKKTFLEASVIRNVAYLTADNAGKEGSITFLTAYDLMSHEMLDKYLIPSLLQWLEVPSRPEVKPDAVPETAPETVPGEVLLVGPSATEEALVPSVLE